MLIIPAIDIRNGKCVRLTQGNYNFETIYSENPVTIAKQWEEQGAKMIHAVDLDGAKDGALTNLETIKKIAQEIKIPIEVGGGIRSKRDVERLLMAGASRVILGTIALDNESELKNILKDFSTKIAVALDTKNGLLMKQGWLKGSNKNIIPTALKLIDLGVKKFIYTDIVNDGMMTEPNYTEISRVLKNIPASVIVGGGISSMNCIEKLNSIGVKEIIIGKALYEGKINLEEAINVG